jgi:hypothetical protein
MVQVLGEHGWPRFEGEMHWVRCFAHLLNIISQVCPFHSAAPTCFDHCRPLIQAVLSPFNRKKVRTKKGEYNSATTDKARDGMYEGVDEREDSEADEDDEEDKEDDDEEEETELRTARLEDIIGT